MDQKKYKKISPRIRIIQKIYNSLLNPNSKIDYPKSQYKKFIKDVVLGTLERSDLIEDTINEHLSENKILTPDLGGNSSSKEVTNSILKILNNYIK